VSRSDAWLLYLSEDECEALLAESWFGRLGVIVDGRPEIFPVNHVWDAATRTVAFPSAHGTKLDAALEWPWVSFEIDGVDEEAMTGWSVLVVGRAERITSTQERERLAAERRGLWRAGAHDGWVRVVPSRVTGRQLGAISR